MSGTYLWFLLTGILWHQSVASNDALAVLVVPSSSPPHHHLPPPQTHLPEQTWQTSDFSNISFDGNSRILPPPPPPLSWKHSNTVLYSSLFSRMTALKLTEFHLLTVKSYVWVQCLICRREIFIPVFDHYRTFSQAIICKTSMQSVSFYGFSSLSLP